MGHKIIRGAPLLPIMGGSDPPTPTPPAPVPPAPTPTADPPPTPERTFTQAEVDRMMGATRDQGRRAAENQLAADLGIPLDEAKQILTAHRERQEAEKTEAQKAIDAANAREAAAAAKESAANAKEHALNVERVLLRSGIPVDRVTVVAKLVDAPVGADETALLAAVEAVKGSVPELFKPADPNVPTPPAPTPKPVAGDPPGTPPKPAPPGDAYQRGMERAKQAGTRSSYDFEKQEAKT